MYVDCKDRKAAEDVGSKFVLSVMFLYQVQRCRLSAQSDADSDNEIQADLPPGTVRCGHCNTMGLLVDLY